MNVLLAAGARPDARDETGRTALMFAASSGNAAAVQALLDAGADLHARDGRGQVVFLAGMREIARLPIYATGSPGGETAPGTPTPKGP